MRPPFLQKLNHDKLLTGKNFPAFVETFNYATTRIDNLLGDKDTDPQSGHIEVDNTDPDHPVIRYNPPDNQFDGAIAVDSQVSAAQLSSLGNVSGLYEIWQFHDMDNAIDVDQDELSTYDVIARKRHNDDKPAEVVYLQLSSLSGGNIDGDADHFNYQGNESIEKKDNAYVQLFRFDQPPYPGAHKIDATTDCIPPEPYQFVLRRYDQDKDRFAVQYANIALDLSNDANISKINEEIEDIQTDLNNLTVRINNIQNFINNTVINNINIISNNISVLPQIEEKIEIIQNQICSISNETSVLNIYITNISETLCNNYYTIEDIDNITSYIDQHIDYNSTMIYELSGYIDTLSDKYWVKGGDYNDNYGASIGDSNQNIAIDLDPRQMMGDWENTGDLTVRQNLYLDNGSLIIREPTSSIVIGGTSLTEDKLQRLLALIGE